MLDFLYSACIDEFTILKFSMIFTQKRHRRQLPPPPPNVHMTFLVDKIDMWRFPKSWSTTIENKKANV